MQTFHSPYARPFWRRAIQEEVAVAMRDRGQATHYRQKLYTFRRQLIDAGDEEAQTWLAAALSVEERAVSTRNDAGHILAGKAWFIVGRPIDSQIDAAFRAAGLEPETLDVSKDFGGWDEFPHSEKKT